MSEGRLEIVRDAHFAFEKVVRQELGGKEMTVKEKAEAVKVLPEFFKVNGEYFFLTDMYRHVVSLQLSYILSVVVLACCICALYM